jgi:hypothetical protein
MYGGIRTYVELHRTEKSLSSHNDEARRRPAKWMFGRSFHIQNLSTIILSIRDHMMEIMRRHHVLKLPSKALTCPCLSRRWLSHFWPCLIQRQKPEIIWRRERAVFGVWEETRLVFVEKQSVTGSPRTSTYGRLQ